MRLLKFLVASAAVVVTAVTIAPRAEASLIMTLEQVGSNVVATGSGSIDTTALSLLASNAGSSWGIAPYRSYLIVGAPATVNEYGYISGPTSFGSGTGANPDTESGDIFGLFAYNGQIYIEAPNAYLSGAALKGSSTWNATTLSALGVTTGTYTWNWGTGTHADSLTLYAGVAAPAPAGAATPVPEPSSLAIFGTALAALGLLL